MDEDERIRKIIEAYESYARENGFRLNPDRKMVENLVRGLLLNEAKHGARYCPCRRVAGDESDRKKICPCFWHKEEIRDMGHCHCRLFVK